MIQNRTKPRSSMLNYIMQTVDKAFYTVYEGEPVKCKQRSNTEGSILEEEVLFCKNNVCVHQPGNEELKHVPGYMCMKKIFRADGEISDLMLSWVPNTLLANGTAEQAEAVGIIGDDVQDSSPIHVSRHENQNVSLLHQDLVCAREVHPKNFETPLGDVFSINLLDVKTVKLFFVDKTLNSGQFVIGSHENEYKVFHFHTNGLTRLSEIFCQWNGCSVDKDINPTETMQQMFNVAISPKNISENGRQLHPEEGRYRAMNMNAWLSCINQYGQIEDGFNFRKHVFFGGLSQEVRPDAWKFLLYYYPIHSTKSDRDMLKVNRVKSYNKIHQERLSLDGEIYETFWRKVQFTVDKDVVRTDRSHPYYAGQDNPNMQKMRNILLNYAIYNPSMGYTQGMSDLVAPLLATLHDEVDSFWCFVGIMESSMFATVPTDNSMEKSLGFLRELLRLMQPEFYMHCLCQDYDLNLLFAHRWLVLCFKREFILHEVLKIWEACWTRYQTDYFHIFVCVALVSLYGNTCIENNLKEDEILLYFMSIQFDGSAALKEARYLLYKFRQMNRIPCSLRGLLSGKGVWDGGILPEVECVSHHHRCCRESAVEKESEDDVTRDNVKEDDTMREGVTEDDTTRDNVTEDDTMRDSVTEDDTTRDVTEDDTTRDNVTEDDTMRDSVTEDDTMRDSVTEDDTTRDSVTEDDTTRDNVTEDDTMRDSVTEDDTTRDSVTEDDTTRDSVTEDDTTRDNVTEDDTTRDSVTEDDTMREGVTEDDTTRDSVTEDDTTRDVTEDDTKSDNVTEDDTIRDSVTEDDTTRDTITEDDTTRDNVTEDDTTRDTITEDDTTRDNVTVDDTTRDNVTEDDTTRDNVTVDDTTRDNVTRENSALTESTNKNSADVKM